MSFMNIGNCRAQMMEYINIEQSSVLGAIGLVFLSAFITFVLIHQFGPPVQNCIEESRSAEDKIKSLYQSPSKSALGIMIVQCVVTAYCASLGCRFFDIALNVEAAVYVVIFLLGGCCMLGALTILAAVPQDGLCLERDETNSSAARRIAQMLTSIQALIIAVCWICARIVISRHINYVPNL